MDAKSFFELTARMRKAQKQYFQLRKQSANKAEIQEALRLSKYLESQLDREIARVERLHNEPTLFTT